MELTSSVHFSAWTGHPLGISRLEKVAARRLLRSVDSVLTDEERPHYSIGRNESGYSEHVEPLKVTYLSKVASIPRSTTCMLVRGTHRVEDDPIIRFEPYFSADSSAKTKEPHRSTTGRFCKETLMGMDDEVKEFVLRYVVRTCGSTQSVFDALRRTGVFPQPLANYSDILDHVNRRQLWKRQLRELEAQRTSDDISTLR